MRSTCRLFMAAILLTAAAGVARAQDPSPAPPAPASDVAKPVAELPPIPVAEPNVPAVEPAIAAVQIAPAVEPPAAAPVEQPVAEKQVTTTTRRVTKKTPAEKPAVQVNESIKPAAAAASTAAIDTTANPPPPDAAANTAPLKSIAPAPSAAKAVTVESQSEEAIPQKKLGIGSWILATVLLLALAGIATKFLRRRTARRTSIVDLTVSAELKPALVPRP